MLGRSTSVFTVTNADDSGRGSLREAVERANAVGEATIAFAIDSGPVVINLQSPLPRIGFSGGIDGSTQPGCDGLPMIELDGAAVASESIGLEIVASGVAVRGIAVTGWSGDGVFINAAHNIALTGIYAGVRLDGLTAAGNGGAGIHFVGSFDNIVGGEDQVRKVVVSGNAGHGLFLDAGTRNTLVTGSCFGTDKDGKRPLSNGITGVKVTQAPSNIIGGRSAGGRNIISGNNHYGVSITGPEAHKTIVQGNFVGVDVSGSTAIPNHRSGVLVINVPACRIGGPSVYERNIISGNMRAGVTVDGSLIHSGMPVEHGGLGYTKGVAVEGNYIGVDCDGVFAIPNHKRGVLLNYCQKNTVFDNIISGNSEDGILILGPNDNSDERVVPSENIIIRNKIGVSAQGNQPVGNCRHGVYVQHGRKNVIGGRGEGDANIIKHNGKRGITFRGLGFDTNIQESNIIDKNGLGSFYQAL